MEFTRLRRSRGCRIALQNVTFLKALSPKNQSLNCQDMCGVVVTEVPSHSN